MEVTKYFTIADVATLSGLKAHTLRIWEQRYALFKPQRSTGNTRQYSLRELDYVLKLAVLNQAGYKISRLIDLDSAAVHSNLLHLQNEEDKRAREIGRLIISIFEIDTEQFEAILDNCIFLWGLDKTINCIIIPLMERVHLYTCKNCEVEVDFAVTAIRRKIFFAIEKADPLVTVNRTALLFLPQGEYYDLLLLYYFYILKSKGLKVLYMGTNISFEKIKYVVDLKHPDFLITFISPEQKRRVDEIKQFAYSYIPKATLLAAAFEPLEPEAEAEQAANVRVIHYKKITEFLPF